MDWMEKEKWTVLEEEEKKGKKKEVKERTWDLRLHFFFSSFFFSLFPFPFFSFFSFFLGGGSEQIELDASLIEDSLQYGVLLQNGTLLISSSWLSLPSTFSSDSCSSSTSQVEVGLSILILALLVAMGGLVHKIVMQQRKLGSAMAKHLPVDSETFARMRQDLTRMPSDDYTPREIDMSAITVLQSAGEGKFGYVHKFVARTHIPRRSLCLGDQCAFSPLFLFTFTFAGRF